MPVHYKSLYLRIAGILVAICAALALCGCKPKEEEGQWIELPGGRMVYGTPGKPENIERLIYKIDDERYFTMMVSETYATCGGGTVWYHDKGRGIESKVGSTEVDELPIFALDPDKSLAIPIPNGDLQFNSRMLFSTDYGKTWNSIRFAWPGAGMIVKDDVLLLLEGSAGYQDPIYISGARVWSFEKLHAVMQQPDPDPPSSDSYLYRGEKYSDTQEGYEFHFRYGATDSNTPDLKIDVAEYAKVTPPSGWRHMRCEEWPNSGKQHN